MPAGGPLQVFSMQRKRRDSNSQRARGALPVFGTGSSSSRVASMRQCGGRDSNPQSLTAPRLQRDPLPVTVYLLAQNAKQEAGFEPARALRRWFCRPAPSTTREPLRLLIAMIERACSRHPAGGAAGTIPHRFNGADRRIFSARARSPRVRREASFWTDHHPHKTSSAPGGIRTPTLRIRNPALSPVELRAHSQRPRLDSNQQPPGLESGALPFELHGQIISRITKAARGWSRTSGLRSFNPALYRLSYTAMC